MGEQTLTPLEDLVAANLRRLRGGRTQEWVAERARRLGLRWQQATVAALEAKRRKLSLGEALLAQAIYARPLAEMLATNPGDVVSVEGVEIGGGTLGRLAAGDWEPLGERLSGPSLFEEFVQWATNQGMDPAEAIERLGSDFGPVVKRVKEDER